MFRRFFHLAKNGDWFTFETSQIDVSLISSLVTTLGSWKDRLFWVSKSVVPFKMVWRHPDAVLNEREPSKSELNEGMLKAIKACPSRLRLFPEHLSVFTGVTFLMLFLGIRKPLRVKMPSPGLLRVDWFLGGSMVLKLKEERSWQLLLGRKESQVRSGEEPVEGNAEDVYVSNWQVKVRDNFKSSTICEDVLNHFSPPTVCSSNSVMQDDVLILRMLLGVGNLAVMVHEGVSHLRKRMHEYEEFLKKREKTKASMAAMKNEIEGFAEKERS
ncbi:hypothetical protein Hdeb2414_s0044g00742101 [Helianthus debilis subsp. tardiflorus]